MADVKVSALTALTGANLANGDQFLVTDVGSPNVSKSITADELAQGSQFSGRFVPMSAQQVTIGAAAMSAGLGSPSLVLSGDGSRWTGWLLDSASTESVVAHLDVPSTWATFDAFLYWINAGAGSGDVSFSAIFDRAGNGDTLSTGRGAAGQLTSTVTAAAQDVMTVTQIFTGQAVNTTKLINMRLHRNGGDAADTLANDIQVFALVLVRAS
jgi:hypothetical protein